jgi:hypothetical protein
MKPIHSIAAAFCRAIAITARADPRMGTAARPHADRHLISRPERRTDDPRRTQRRMKIRDAA